MKRTVTDCLEGLRHDLANHPDDPAAERWQRDVDAYLTLLGALDGGRIVITDSIRRVVGALAASIDMSNEYSRVTFEHGALVTLADQLAGERAPEPTVTLMIPAEHRAWIERAALHWLHDDSASLAEDVDRFLEKSRAAAFIAGLGLEPGSDARSADAAREDVLGLSRRLRDLLDVAVALLGGAEEVEGDVGVLAYLLDSLTRRVAADELREIGDPFEADHWAGLPQCFEALAWAAGEMERLRMLDADRRGVAA
ncbi:MAG: hypothetical protein WD810_06535 [Solirubrobacterales bacterium]